MGGESSPGGTDERHTALSPSRPLALSPSRFRALSPSRPLALSPSRPLALSPSRPLALSPSRPLALSPSYCSRRLTSLGDLYGHQCLEGRRRRSGSRCREQRPEWPGAGDVARKANDG